MNRRNFIHLAGLSAASLVAGCVGLEEMLKKDPGAVIDSVGRIGTAAVKAAQDITPEQERYLGRSVSARILAQYRLSNNRRLYKYVNLVGATLGMVSDRPDLEYHFAVLDTDEVNAFAAPAGYIFVTSGMIRDMDSEEQLAGVLAHEVGHASAKHSIKSVKGELWKQVATVTASETARHQGVDPQLLGLFDQATSAVADVLMTTGYSQSMEYEADALSLTYVSRAGYDSSAVKSYLAQMEAQEAARNQALTMRLKTHPSFSSRVKRLPGASGPAPSAEDIRKRTARFKAITV